MHKMPRGNGARAHFRSSMRTSPAKRPLLLWRDAQALNLTSGNETESRNKFKRATCNLISESFRGRDFMEHHVDHIKWIHLGRVHESANVFPGW